MSNFGNETVSATMGMAGKGIEAMGKSVGAIMQLLKYLLAHQERKAMKLSNKLKKAQIKDMKNEEYRNDCIEYLNTKKGVLKLKKMIGSKQKITTISQTMSEKNFTRFAELAKMYGISCATAKDKGGKELKKELKKELRELNKKGELSETERSRVADIEKELENLKNRKEEYIVFVFEKDLEAVMDITNRMNRELRLEAIDKELKDIINKGEENLSDEDKNRIDELNKEKNSIINEEFDNINDKYNDNVINDTYTEMNFKEAVEKLADRGIDKEPAVICERTEPSNHIIIHSEERTYEDRVHTDTIFDVYKNDEKQTCDLYKHGEFSFKHDMGGRPTSEWGISNWAKLKEEMKDKGNFSNNVIVFKSVSEYQKYRSQFEKAQAEMKKENTIKVETDKDSYKDYTGIINNLRGQLEEHNLTVNNENEICKAGSNTPIVEKELSANEKMQYKDAVLLVKQINTYENMNSLQTKMAFINEQKEMNEELYENSKDKEAIKINYERSKTEYEKSINEIKEKIDTLSKEADELEMKRESLVSVDIVEDIKNERNNEVEVEDTNEEEKENTLGEEKEEKDTQSKEQWEKDISNNKANNNIGTQKENVKNIDTQDKSRE